MEARQRRETMTTQTTRYFRANVEDAVRIAVVTADGEYADEDIRRAFPAHSHVEINKTDLPADFATWQSYDKFAYSDDVFVDTRSRRGEIRPASITAKQYLSALYSP